MDLIPRELWCAHSFSISLVHTRQKRVRKKCLNGISVDLLTCICVCIYQSNKFTSVSNSILSMKWLNKRKWTDSKKKRIRKKTKERKTKKERKEKSPGRTPCQMFVIFTTSGKIKAFIYFYFDKQFHRMHGHTKNNWN